MSEVVDRVATKKREAQMLVNNRMQAYRTTPSEKLLGTVSKYSLIGYLEGIKKVIANSEGLINEQEKMFEDVIQKAKSEVAKWEAEYVLIHTKALRAELKKKISAPSRDTFYLSPEEVRLPLVSEQELSLQPLIIMITHYCVMPRQQHLQPHFHYLQHLHLRHD
jgi:hypothetical protein